MTSLRTLFLQPLAGLLLLSTLALSASIEDRTVVRHEKGSTSASYGYIEILPHLYNNRSGGEKFPLILTLHGGGGTGNGTSDLGTNSMMKLLKDSVRFNRSSIFDEHGVIAIEPQSSGSWNTGALRTFILYLIDTYDVDVDRIYVTGPSMGGKGTWNCVRDNGDLIAACVPICGRGPGSGTKYLDIPTWAFHGWDDATVPYTTSVDQCNKIAAAVGGVGSTDMLANYPHQYEDTNLAATMDMTGTFTTESGWIWSSGINPTVGPHPKITLFPNVGHNAWDLTWGNSEVFEWMLSYQRGGNQISPNTAITLPQTAKFIGHGESLEFAGSATDSTGNPISSSSLTWSSDLDGTLGFGNSITTNQLSLGIHQITLRAVDTDGNSSAEKTTVTVSRTTPHTTIVYFNSENTGTQTNRIWSATGSINNPVDTLDQETSMQVSITDRFQNKSYDRFVILAGDDDRARITIRGLSQQLLYNLRCRIPVTDRIQAQDFSTSYNASIQANSKDTGEYPCLNNQSGSWTEYQIEVDHAGSHSIDLRTSCQLEDSVAKIYSGETLVGSIAITSTGSWTSWDTSSGTIDLPSGKQTLRIEQSGGFRLNWLDISDTRLSSAPILTSYSVDQQSTTLNPYSEDSASISNILPDDEGTIHLDVTLGPESLVGYLGELQIEAIINPNPPVPDTEAPSTPSLATSALSDTSTRLIWSAASDNVAMSHYVIKRDGSIIVASTAATSVLDPDLAPATSYSYTVTAVDSSGNYSEESLASEVTTLAAVVAPSLSSGLKQDVFGYWAFDEGSGTNTADAEGENDGTLTGAIWDTNHGMFGSSLSFDGSGDDVSVGTQNPVSADGSMSISLWATANSLSSESNSFNGLVGKRNGYDSSMPFQFGFKQLIPRIERNGSSASIGSVIGTAASGWDGYKHIVLTIADATATVYIDGQKHGSAPYILGTATDAPMTIGATAPTKATWDGNIDDVAIWSRALTAEEVQLIFDAGQDGLALNAISDFSTWARNAGLDGSATKGRAWDDDPDADSLSNLSEYALGGNPLEANHQANTFIVKSSSEGPSLDEFCYTVAMRSELPEFSGSPLSASAGNILYTVEASTDLQNFTIPVSETSTAADHLPPLPSGYEYRSFCADTPEGSYSAIFFRVTVTATP